MSQFIKTKTSSGHQNLYGLSVSSSVSQGTETEAAAPHSKWHTLLSRPVTTGLHLNPVCSWCTGLRSRVSRTESAACGSTSSSASLLWLFLWRLDDYTETSRDIRTCPNWTSRSFSSYFHWTHPSLSWQTAPLHFYSSPSCSGGRAARYLKAEGCEALTHLDGQRAESWKSAWQSAGVAVTSTAGIPGEETPRRDEVGRHCSKAQIEADHGLYRLLPQSVACTWKITKTELNPNIPLFILIIQNKSFIFSFSQCAIDSTLTIFLSCTVNSAVLLVVLQLPGPYSLDWMKSLAACCWYDAVACSFTVVTV